MENTVTKVILTTDCECEIYDEETGEFRPSDGTECFGCYDSAWNDFTENFARWLDSVGGTDENKIVIRGEGMGWERRAGWAIFPASEAHEALTINGEYRVDYSFDGSELTAVRYSHDEPTGTGRFLFSLLDFDINGD